MTLHESENLEMFHLRKKKTTLKASLARLSGDDNSLSFCKSVCRCKLVAKQNKEILVF